MESFFLNVLSQLNLNTVVIILLGVIFFYRQYKADEAKVTTEVINAYKIQVEQYKDEVKSLREAVNDLNQKLGHQDGVILEKDKLVKSYELIFANRNPELEKILVRVVDFMEKIEKRMGFAEIELKKQTTILEEK